MSVALTAAAIALAVYARALDAPFVFDDVTFADSAIVQVASLREAAGILSMEGVPRTLTMATFALNFLADGLDPRGYHLVNVALHVATALAVFVLMRSLLRRWPDPWWAARAAGIAWAGALLWLVHPIQTQAVVYTWQRATVLCACCYLWSLAAYVAGRSRQGWRRVACYAAAIALGRPGAAGQGERGDAARRRAARRVVRVSTGARLASARRGRRRRPRRALIRATTWGRGSWR